MVASWQGEHCASMRCWWQKAEGCSENLWSVPGLHSLCFCLETHVLCRYILLRPHIQPLTIAYFYNEGNIRPFTKVNWNILFCLQLLKKREKKKERQRKGKKYLPPCHPRKERRINKSPYPLSGSCWSWYVTSSFSNCECFSSSALLCLCVAASSSEQRDKCNSLNFLQR